MYMTGTDRITQGLIAGELAEISAALQKHIDDETKRRGPIVALDAEYVYTLADRLRYFSKKLKGEL